MPLLVVAVALGDVSRLCQYPLLYWLYEDGSSPRRDCSWERAVDEATRLESR